MTDGGQVGILCRFLRFTKAEAVFGCKVWIFWGDDLGLRFQEYRVQLVLMQIAWSGSTFQFSAVHAKCTRVGMRQLLEAMETVSAQC